MSVFFCFCYFFNSKKLLFQHVNFSLFSFGSFDFRQTSKNLRFFSIYLQFYFVLLYCFFNNENDISSLEYMIIKKMFLKHDNNNNKQKINFY